MAKVAVNLLLYPHKLYSIALSFVCSQTSSLPAKCQGQRSMSIELRNIEFLKNRASSDWRRERSDYVPESLGALQRKHSVLLAKLCSLQLKMAVKLDIV